MIHSVSMSQSIMRGGGGKDRKNLVTQKQTTHNVVAYLDPLGVDQQQHHESKEGEIERINSFKNK